MIQHTSYPSEGQITLSTAMTTDTVYLEMPIEFERQQFFWSRVRKDGDHLIWEGASVPRGYGKIQIGEDIEYAHRISYCIAKGVEPQDIAHLTVLITCGRNDCVAPDHLATRPKKK